MSSRIQNSVIILVLKRIKIQERHIQSSILSKRKRLTYIHKHGCQKCNRRVLKRKAHSLWFGALQGARLPWSVHFCAFYIVLLRKNSCFFKKNLTDEKSPLKVLFLLYLLKNRVGKTLISCCLCPHIAFAFYPHILILILGRWKWWIDIRYRVFHIF